MDKLVRGVRDFWLEKNAQHNLLEALASVADGETYMARISMIGLESRTRQSTRSVRRALACLSTQERGRPFHEWRDSLILTIDRPGGGPGAAGAYRVHFQRILIVANAVRIARRAIRAGADRELDLWRLRGRPATYRNCAEVIGTLRHALIAEGHQAQAKQLLKLRSELDLEMSSWPGRILGAHSPDAAVDNSFIAKEKCICNSAISSEDLAKLATSPTPPYKDNTP